MFFLHYARQLNTQLIVYIFREGVDKKALLFLSDLMLES